MSTDDEWRQFLCDHFKTNDPMGHSYQIKRTLYIEDRRTCLAAAEEGIPRAVEYREAFALWKLTK